MLRSRSTVAASGQGCVLILEDDDFSPCGIQDRVMQSAQAESAATSFICVCGSLPSLSVWGWEVIQGGEHKH